MALPTLHESALRRTTEGGLMGYRGARAGPRASSGADTVARDRPDRAWRGSNR